MAKIYATLIMANKREFSKLKSEIKDEVKEVFRAYVQDKTITEDQYKMYVGESYVA